MMTNEKNVANLLITRAGITRVAVGQTIDAAVAASTAFPGIPFVINVATGQVPDAQAFTAANTPAIKIGVPLTDGTINWSDTIEGKNVKSVTALRSALPRQQLDYIGYNGTAGAIDVVANNLYTIRLYLNPLDTAGWMQQFIKRATYQSTVADTQATIAAGLAKSLIANLSREVDKQKYGIDRIGVQLVNSGVSIATSGGTLDFVKGSSYVTIRGTGADAGQYAGDTATIVAGDYLRVGHATTATFPVYRVDQVVSGGGANTMVVKLNIPYQGATAMGVAAANVGVMPIANIANFGIAITGVAYTSDPPKFFYQIPRWTTTIEGFTTTTVTNSVVPFEGRGTRDQVRELEQQLLGSEGNFYRAQVPYPTFRSETVASTAYAWIVIEYVDNMTSHLGQSAVSHKQLYIACDRVGGTSISDNNTGLGTTLNRFVAQHAIAANTAAIHTEVAQVAIV
jgi:hypothetical protein